jgi:hypothetical protein
MIRRGDVCTVGRLSWKKRGEAVMRKLTRAALVSGSVVTLVACHDATRPVVQLTNAPIAINWGIRVQSSGGAFFLGAVDSLGRLQLLIDTVPIPDSGEITLRVGEAGFAQKTAWMTNGEPDPVRYGVVLVPSGTTDGFNTFDFIVLARNSSDPDLAGHALNSVSLMVDSARVDSPGSDPNHDGVWTDVRFYAHLVVFGESL